jgi:hypothetical protein
MPPLAATQDGFARSLLRARLQVPSSVAETAGPSRERRFAVYRNNVKASLVAALAAKFPVVHRLVGEEFFEATALVFIERHPPRSPVLAEYGCDFAGFLEGFEPAADLPYLPDVARLEWARQRAFHAADAPPVAIDRLAALAAGDLGSAKLLLHPAARVVVSPWPIVSIWTTNTFDAEVRRIGPDRPGETALVTRPDQDVLVGPLPPGAGPLIAALEEGATLGDAMANVPDAFDLPTALASLFGAGAVFRILEGPPA